MVSIFRVKTTWSGFNGAPGYTNFFFRNVIPGGAPTTIDDQASALAAAERTYAFWNALKAMLPSAVKLNIDTVVDELEDTNGALLGSRSVTSQGQIGGTSAASYSAATGAVVGWGTSTVLNRRRIRGRTFIVPVVSVAFSNGGRINPAEVTTLRNAATALAIGGVNSTFGVWSRPVTQEMATATNPVRDGKWAEATSVRVTDLPAVLRSRRD